MAKSAEFTMGKRLGRLATGAAATALALGGFVAAAGSAGAAPAPSGPGGLQSITEYATYPPPLPGGCPGGRDALTGVEFSNGHGFTSPSFSALAGSVNPGDTVTMTWTGFAPSCENVTVGLAAYDISDQTAQLGYFDPNVDQSLLPGWTVCGGDAPACAQANGTYSLSITIPTIDVSCRWQLDALLGRPLAVVGPSGAFYNSALRGDGRPSMQIDYLHWGTENCVPAVQPLTPPTTPPTTPPPTPAPEVQPETPTTQPAEVEAVQVTAPPTTEAPVEVMAAEVSRTQLPTTGAQGSGLLAAVAAALLAAGAGLLAQGRRMARRNA